MGFIKKHKKIINGIWTVIVWFCLISLFEKGHVTFAFYLTFALMVLNHAASYFNEWAYQRMSELVDQGNKLSENLVIQCQRALGVANTRQEIIEKLRQMIAISNTKELEMRDINDRLNEVNKELRRKMQELMTTRRT